MKTFITVLTISLTVCVFTGCATEPDVSTTGDDKDGVKTIVVNNRMTSDKLMIRKTK